MRKRYEIRDLRKTKSLPAALDLIRQAFITEKEKTRRVDSRARLAGRGAQGIVLVPHV